MFGQVLGIFITSIAASTTLFQTNISSTAIAKTLKEEKIWALFAVPRFLKNLEDYVRRAVERKGRSASFEKRFAASADMKFPARIWTFRDIHSLLGWRFWAMVVGGAHVDPASIEFWRRLGYAVVQGYGLTETAPIISINNPFGPSRYSAGRVVGDQEVRIAEDGEILVRGSNVMQGYLDDEVATEAVFRDGWFRTGDIGEIDETGHLHIKGRKKDVIVTGEGMNVFPDDIERHLNEHPALREGIVIGKKVDSHEEVHAVIIPNERGADLSPVVREVNAKLEPHQKIKGFTVWKGNEFPMTSTMKIKKREIAGVVSGEKEKRREETFEDGLAKVLSSLAGGKGEALASGAKLTDDLGLSSLDRVELACLLEEKFNVEIDENLIGVDTSVEDLKKIVESKPGREPTVPFPSWPRKFPATWIRSVVQLLIGFPILRFFCRISERSQSRLEGIEPPVILVSNHSSHFDTPTILASLPFRLRKRVTPAMTTTFFDLIRRLSDVRT